ncbi:MAG: sulfatase-like hydrolase/transferase, partial [Thermodesulfobacteriota bacterium]
VWMSPPGLRVRMARISMILVVSLPLIFIFAATGKSYPIPPEIRLNPTFFLLSDVAGNTIFKQKANARHRNRMNHDESPLQPPRPMEDLPMNSATFLPPKSSHDWNLVIFIMESVGTRYIFDTSYGNRMPMPFLHRIAKEGWHFKRHYTTSNVSTKAIFSLLSGLYDFFNRKSFGNRPDAGVPAIYNFLGKHYDRFLVTPSSISWYFPTAFVKNGGPLEIHSYENLNFRMKEEIHSLGRYIARDEIQTVDFFIQRLNKAREPFLGIYISFAAHFPYFDYGADYRILEEDGRLISRYYNNLNLLDHMIKRIYDHLQYQGLLERTILVIVGDHGQAFGQHHPNNYMHYRYSYNENLETPAILYQPALFKPKAFEFATSHVDILPTLLDAMRIPYQSMFLNGESLFHQNLKRKSIFFYGYEECISSLDSSRMKVHYSLKQNRCWAFDLKLDPDEKNPLDCSLYQSQLGDLRHFVSNHDSRLLQYNAQIGWEKGF